jgi:hypothetical protein
VKIDLLPSGFFPGPGSGLDLVAEDGIADRVVRELQMRAVLKEPDAVRTTPQYFFVMASAGRYAEVFPGLPTFACVLMPPLGGEYVRRGHYHLT